MTAPSSAALEKNAFAGRMLLKIIVSFRPLEWSF
jgi:hypothetical protein